MTKPVVLIAEELSPATVEALGPDFEIRNCDGADHAELLPAIADGRIRPVVDRVFPFAELPAAVACMESSAHLGKIVVRVSG